MPRVLLVLGYQADYLLDPPAGIPAAADIRANIDLVLASARQAPSHTLRIIHVRNVGEPGDPADPEGTQTRELVHPALPGEFVVDKRKSNAFTETTLADLIAPDEEIVVVGLLSDYSVKFSAFSSSFLSFAWACEPVADACTPLQRVGGRWSAETRCC